LFSNFSQTLRTWKIKINLDRRKVERLKPPCNSGLLGVFVPSERKYSILVAEAFDLFLRFLFLLVFFAQNESCGRY
jgi:hypothetical protein